jgi:hypothetical protein
MPAISSCRSRNSSTYSQHEPITNICYFLVPAPNLRRNPQEQPMSTFTTIGLDIAKPLKATDVLDPSFNAAVLSGVQEAAAR